VLLHHGNMRHITFSVCKLKTLLFTINLRLLTDFTDPVFGSTVYVVKDGDDDDGDLDLERSRQTPNMGMMADNDDDHDDDDDD